VCVAYLASLEDNKQQGLVNMCQEIADYDSETNLVKTNMVIRVDEILG
jgi:uncharacterized tellurite resistance protein B-like protein